MVGYDKCVSTLRQHNAYLRLFVLLLLSISLMTVFGKELQPTKAYAAETKFDFKIAMHGIGNGGDSANATASGNIDPHYRQRTITVSVFNNQNVLAATADFIVTYDDANGDFRGSIVGSTLPTGAYTISVKADRYLSAKLPGIQNITAGQDNQLSPVTMIAGDINADNKIDVLDYNILMGCYSDLGPAVSCTDDQKTLSDLTDDQAVNQFDYNLFIRELGSRSGQSI